MYKPAPRGDSRDLEFLELYNSNPFPEEISGYRFAGEIHFTFPSNTVLNGRSFVVLARHPADMQAVYGLSGAYGYGTTNYFTNVVSGVTNIATNVVSLGSSGTLKLLNNQDAVLLSVPYSNKSPWPVGADGTGHSLVLARASYGEENPVAWDMSDVKGGSPGRFETPGSEPLHNIVINEFLANVTGSMQQFVELYNHSASSADISGSYLSDVASSLKFRIPNGTVIPGHGYVSFQGSALGFFFNPGGGNLYLMNSNDTRVLDAISYEGQANGISSGRYPDGGPLIYSLSSRTPGTNNAGRLVSNVVINEIMYDPVSGLDDDEYVELFNSGPDPIIIQDWQFSGGISFTFPTNTVVQPLGYLVVCHNVTNLAARYPTSLTCLNAVGDYVGKLGNSSDRIALSKPVPAITTNATGQLRTNIVQVVVDEVSYGPGGRWSQWARGAGASLEKIDPHSDGRLAANWADSDPTNLWVSQSASGVLDNGMGPADQLEIILAGEGECLIDNVEVTLGSATLNIVTNSDFETDSSGWIAEGNHSRSSLEATTGYKSRQSLHLRASGPGDAIANRVFTYLSTPLPTGQTATIRARVNWLRGQNQVIMRIRGGYLETTREARLSARRGTPGAINSRNVGIAPPAIHSVSHSPAVPAANQPVVVTARIAARDPVSSFFLRYRTDPSTTYSSVPMVDNGAGGDAVAGDGIFSATIPGQGAGTLIAFHLEASGQASVATAVFPSGAPGRECLVRFGDPPLASDFGNYRLWTTRQTLDLWTNRSPLDLEPLDATFIYADSRIVYNVGASYAADPLQANFDSPLGQPCHYRLRFPTDDPFLGATDLNRLQASGNIPGEDDTLQRSQTADWMYRQLGLPSGYKRYVNFFFNGVRRGSLMEDAQVTDGEFLDEWFAGQTDGTLFHQQPWLELDAAGSPTNYGGCTFNDFVTVARSRNVARFRANWNPEQFVPGTDPFADLFDLIDAANRDYLGAVADLEQWTRNFALQHALGNVDSFGNINSFNSFAYAPPGELWQLLPGFLNKVLGNSGASGPSGDNLFQYDANDPVMGQLYASRSSRRSYWTALRQIADGPMNPTRVNPMLDAKYGAFQSNGIAAGTTTPLKTWISDRRNFLLTQLSAVSAPFSLFGTNRFTTNENAVVLRGTAPIDTETLTINGVPFVVDWESETNWSMTYFLQKGTNHLQVQAIDYLGNTQTNATATLDVIYQLDLVPPQGYVVINEIMYNPPVGGGSFVELYNSSSSYNFDLSNWRLDGVGFIFPAGTVLRHQSFLVVVADRSVFTSLYGNSIPVAGQFPGGLSNAGELLTLLIPGKTPTEDVIVDQVRYEPIEPWPSFANGGGASLQLVDPRQDNSRVSNWSVQVPGSDPIVFANPTPGATNSTVAALPEYPLLWLNEVEPSNINGITNRAGQRAPWIELFNSSANTIALSQFFLSDQWDALDKWQFPAGAVIGPQQFLILWADGQINQTTASEWHTGFRLPPTNGFVALSRVVAGQPQIMDYLKYSNVASDQSYGCYPDAQGAAREIFLDVTPARSNNVPPRIYINEWMASNTRTLHDPVDGDAEDWFELFNATYHSVDISGWYLTDTLSKKTMFRIPDGTIIGPRAFLLVWADGEPEQNGPESPDLHANFSLSKSGEAIGLYGPDQSLKDYVTFGPQTDDASQGRFVDGSTNTFAMTIATPDQPNFIAPTYPPAPPIFASGGHSIIFVVSDPTAAPFTQNFTLGADAPPGATIDRFTGEFVWTPPAVSVPTTNVFTIVICDLRPGFFPSTLTVTIIVMPAFSITSVNKQADGGLQVSWNSVAGRKYRLQVAFEAGSPVWTDRSPDLFASGSTLMFNVYGFTNAQEFYRIIQLP